MSLSSYLSPAALAQADVDYHANEAAHAKRVADTTAKRKANNLALFGEPSDKGVK